MIPSATPSGTVYFLSSKNPKGKVVVCVHGIGGGSHQFEALFQDLEAAGFRPLRYDLIGRGYSSEPSDKCYDGAAHVAQLRGLLEHLKLASGDCKVDMVAHSMGGAIAALYNDAYPSHVEAMVLLAPAGLMSGGELASLKVLRGCGCLQGPIRGVLRGGQEGEWRKDFCGSAPDERARASQSVAKMKDVAAANPGAFEGFFQSALQFEYLSGLDAVVRRLGARSGFKQKTMIMWGDRDKAVPFANMRRWKAALTAGAATTGLGSAENVTMVSYKNLAHGFFIERPGEVNRAIIDLLAQPLPAAATS
eukprot:CAMPEP_0173396526 /NCGR_PEP_ID=MMETSP1356-20130122/35738_1 /TAXON_ID=77927 ORGANISM="Hemiselmis virescens, Strain PCC157" /NCGR_SAMPLE_ID=MMETSP1356 /ASSEMBLY_ACC=CAM_ASM_000847 /LENGTH=305 /DNA_ID=CAMNT_0014355583 /DNA_START=41 /DNA_END=954 /DNA_ORIENTATION=+